MINTINNVDIFDDGLNGPNGEVVNTLNLLQQFYDFPVVKFIDYKGENNHEIFLSVSKEKAKHSIEFLMSISDQEKEVIYENTIDELRFENERDTYLLFYIQIPIFAQTGESIGLLVLGDTESRVFNENHRGQLNTFINLIQTQMQSFESVGTFKKKERVRSSNKISILSTKTVSFFIALVTSIVVGFFLFKYQANELISQNKYQTQKLKMTLFDAIERFDSQASSLIKKDQLLVGYILSGKSVDVNDLEKIVTTGEQGSLTYKGYALISEDNLVVWSRANFDLGAYNLRDWAENKSSDFEIITIADTAFLVHKLDEIKGNFFTISAFDLNQFFQSVISKLNTQDYSIYLSTNELFLSLYGEASQRNLSGAISASTKIFPSEWRIFVKPNTPILDARVTNSFITLYIVISLILFSVVYYFLRLPRRLQEEIQQKNQTLLKREAFYSRALDSLPDAFAIFDTDDEPLITNKAYSTIFDGIKNADKLAFYELIQIGEESGLITHHEVHHKLEGDHDRIIDLGFSSGRWLTVLQRDMEDGSYVSYFHDDSEAHNKERLLKGILEKSKSNVRAQREFIAKVAAKLSKPVCYLRTFDELVNTQEKRNLLESVTLQLDCTLGLLDEFLSAKAQNRKLNTSKFEVTETINSVVQSIQNETAGKLVYNENTEKNAVWIFSDQRMFKQLITHFLSQVLEVARHTVSVKAETKHNDQFTELHLEFKYKSTDDSKFIKALKQLELFKKSDESLEVNFFISLFKILGGQDVLFSSHENEECITLVCKVEDEEGEVSSNLAVNKTSILLVDDDPLVDVVVKAVLKDQDFEIDYANSAIEALLSLSQKKYEVILMDIVMPELSGVEALHKIKKHSWCNSTAFIAHTASDKENCYEHYKSLGFDDVLLKPVKKDELLRSIDKVLSVKGDSHG